MYSTNFIIDAILENDALVEQWFEFALMLEKAGEIAEAELALLEAIEHESWKLLWQERFMQQETTEMLDAEMLRFLWLDLPDSEGVSYATEGDTFGTFDDAYIDELYEQYENRLLSGCIG
jgi:hypothetical protein